MKAKRNAIRISFMLKKKDKDIMSLFLTSRVRGVLDFAVKRYLGQTSTSLPLPPFEADNEVLYRAVTIYEDTEPDVYAFFETIGKGARSEVAKRLIRHAVDRCDLREFIDDGVDNAPKKKEETSIKPKQVSTRTSPPPPAEKQPQSEESATVEHEQIPPAPIAAPEYPLSSFNPDDEDSIFDLI